MDSKKFLNAEEVAAEFGLDAAALQQFVDSGEVRALADRGTWKYRRDELVALVNSGMIQLPSMDIPVSLSDGNQVLSFQGPDDDVSYIELDEDALAEQATMISKSKPEPQADEPEQDWFVPSDAAEMSAAVEQSSSDVAIYSGPDQAAEAESSLAAGSDSDVQIAPEFQTPRPEDSGILLDFNLDAGATVSSSGSSLRLPQTAPDPFEDDLAVTDEGEWAPEAESAEPSVVGMGPGESGINLDSGDDGSLQVGGDSGVQLIDATGSGVKMRTEESGILLDEGSRLGMSAGSSVLASAADADSGITLEAPPDSGISLDVGSPAAATADDSGLAMEAADSGISLGSFDSGLSLESADSGLMLDSGDSGIAIDGNAKTMADDDLRLNLGDQTQTLDTFGDTNDDSAFEINLDDGDATSELFLDDDEWADETSATVVRKGRSDAGSLSDTFDLDDGAAVEDLEISQDLDAGIEDEVEELTEEEEVFEASDDVFGETVEEEDDSYLEPTEKAKKPAGPREPAWGAGLAVGLVACSLFLAANSLILWSGVSTMWTGADVEGPAASLIQTLADLIKT